MAVSVEHLRHLKSSVKYSHVLNAGWKLVVALAALYTLQVPLKNDEAAQQVLFAYK
jgi:hypothetical protein